MSVVGAFFDWIDDWNGSYELLILMAAVAALLSETWKPWWRRLWRDIRKMIASNRVSAEIATTPAERSKMACCFLSSRAMQSSSISRSGMDTTSPFFRRRGSNWAWRPRQCASAARCGKSLRSKLKQEQKAEAWRRAFEEQRRVREAAE